MYLYKSFADGCIDTYNDNHDLDASGFTWLDRIVNSQMFRRSISGFGGIGVTVGISS